MCPIKALTDWISYIEKNKHYNGMLAGFVFRKRVGLNSTSDEGSKAMVSPKDLL